MLYYVWNIIISRLKAIFGEQQEGTAIYCPVFLWIKNKFQKDLQYFPKRWLKYVREVFALFDTKKIQGPQFYAIV